MKMLEVKAEFANKALQLRNLRQRILSYYNAKYKGQYASSALMITENILETQQLVVDINQQNLVVDEIEKAQNSKIEFLFFFK